MCLHVTEDFLRKCSNELSVGKYGERTLPLLKLGTAVHSNDKDGKVNAVTFPTE